MEEKYADLVVIGSGPSGHAAAIQAAKLGKKVIMVEKDAYLGGNSLNRGTIPSKTLREAILDLTRFHDRSFYGEGEGWKRSEVSLTDLTFRLNKVLDNERRKVERQLRKNNVERIHGEARFINNLQIDVINEDGKVSHQVLGDYFVIATGSKPRNPIDVPFDGEVILDSTTLLKIDRVPKTMIVLGGGIIGSEYASFFSALGCEVTIIDKRDHLLPMLDSEIGIHLQTSLSDIGLKFMGRKVPTKIWRDGTRAKVLFEDGTELEADTLLYALGRTANVDGLQIERAGVRVNARGYLPVNALFQTCVPHIYGVGDVIGGPSLASTSTEQGRLAARHAFGELTHYFPQNYPLGIYTIPEISTVGMTEEEVKEKGYRYEVGRAYYYELARAQISGSDKGMFKIIFHKDTKEILGVHVIGRSATEVVHIGMVAMTFNAKIDYFIDQIFNYPTFAEGFRVAALNGINKLTKQLGKLHPVQ